MYVEYVQKKYTSCTIVFDGYRSGPSTKDNAHLRRSKGKTGKRVKIGPSKVMNGKKDDILIFLLHKENKHEFIEMLASSFNEKDIECIQAEADADVLISKTAIRHARSKSTTVIAEDTDVLFLLCQYWDEDCYSTGY